VIVTGVAHAVRGALIGLVELVPGVSGGTVALVLGIYDRLVLSAHHFLRGITGLLPRRVAKSTTSRTTTRTTASTNNVNDVKRRARTGAPSSFAAVEWLLILPLIVGMFAALFTLATPLHTFVETQPVGSSALFLGMVTASLLVPISMARDAAPPLSTRSLGSRMIAPIVILGIAAVAFVVLGLPTLAIGQPPVWVIVLSGAAAVCALALPGLSGSFVLLTLGLYEPTLEAVSTRDTGYLLFFIVGAVLGLVSVVQLLAYLLRAHRRAVLLVATGLILGSLRALWPWQDGSTLLTPPPGESTAALLAFAVGAGLVLLLWAWDRRKSVSATTTGITRATI
jgi:putative membrane protein